MKSTLGLYWLAFLFALTGLASESRADFLDVCERTPQIRDFLVQAIHKDCSTISSADLRTVTRIAVPNTGIDRLQVGDFSGLTQLDTLNLKANQISELPEGVFTDLPKLRVLVLLKNPLTHLPNDFTVGNDNLEKIHVFRTRFSSIPQPVIENLKRLPKLNVLDVSNGLDQSTKDRLWQAFPRESERVTLIFS